MNFKLFFHLGYMKEYLIIGLALGFLFALYIFFKSKRIFRFLKKNPKSKGAVTIRIILALLVIPFTYNPWSPAMLIAFYIIMLNAAVDIVLSVINLFRKGKESLLDKIYLEMIIVALIFAGLLGQGIYKMNHIVESEYTENNDVNDGEIKICFMSDLHFGTIQSPERLSEKIEEINSKNYDIIILGGDITDERTSKEDMALCYSMLGKLNSTYGTYFIYGNHDRQPYTTDYVNGKRTYTDEELEETILANGIHILMDETLVVGDFVFVGRDDPRWDKDRNRKSIEEILSGDYTGKYIIDLDHQPIEQDEAISNNAQLELSGHTHGGQVFPFDLLIKFSSTYVYGKYDIDDFSQIVSSGFTGWGWPVRNVYYCEYVTIEIK